MKKIDEIGKIRTTVIIRTLKEKKITRTIIDKDNKHAEVCMNFK